MATKSKFTFFLSCDVNLQVKLKVASLQGVLPCLKNNVEGKNLIPVAAYVVARLSSGDQTLGLETRTVYSEVALQGCSWSEWLVICAKYRDLPHDTMLSFLVYTLAEGDPGPQLLGATSMAMFNKKGRLKTGRQKLKVWEGQGQPTRPGSLPVISPGKVPLKERGPTGQLEHLLKLYHRGDMPQVDWLDSLTLKEISKLLQQHSSADSPRSGLQLVVELPSFPHAVLYHQLALAPSALGYTAPAALTAPLNMTFVRKPGTEGESSTRNVVIQSAGGDTSNLLVHDPEVGRDNPAELKAQKLARSLQRGVIDRELKPNSEEKKRIAAVLRLPPNRLLHAEEKAMMWRFRFSLTQDKRALTKFLKCVDWSDVLEAKQAIELMQQWAAIDTADALELLSPDFKNEEVRSYAVSMLAGQDDDELLCYLLQLVQALRYESSDISKLAKFLVQRAAQNPLFAVMVHWYLFTEWEDPTFGLRASAVHGMLVNELRVAQHGEQVLDVIRRQTDMVSQLAYINKDVKASKLKAAKAGEKLRVMIEETGPCGELTALKVPLPLNPLIMLDGVVPSECFCFKSAMLPLCISFKVDVASSGLNWLYGTAAPPVVIESRHSSSMHHGALSYISGTVVGSNVPAAFHGQHHHHYHQTPLQGTASGELPSMMSSLSRQMSAAQPVLQETTGIVGCGRDTRCWIIYKKGDDLRQDQFILQMISLMDRLLKRENLDLRLTPYKVLPTSSDDGLVEFVPSQSLSKVLSEHRTIAKYLQMTHANVDSAGPFGLRMEVLETFVRSCAGYCVMTYILGVGDRHLDNLMLCKDGRLFHIDFGYILGQDPKPFPPPMKLCKEMIEAMGGQDSIYYVQFRMYACEAYNILRKSADLILSLFHLMAGSAIESIRQDPEKAMLKLQEKLRLEIDDEQAVQWMQSLINESATALMPQIVETTHRWAQYWR